jgi:hypothetical protein
MCSWRRCTFRFGRRRSSGRTLDSHRRRVLGRHESRGVGSAGRRLRTEWGAPALRCAERHPWLRRSRPRAPAMRPAGIHVRASPAPLASDPALAACVVARRISTRGRAIDSERGEAAGRSRPVRADSGVGASIERRQDVGALGAELARMAWCDAPTMEAPAPESAGPRSRSRQPASDYANQSPMCAFNHALTVSCHSTLLRGLSTQWFSSGKNRNFDSMPRRCSAVKVARPCSVGMR